MSPNFLKNENVLIWTELLTASCSVEAHTDYLNSLLIVKSKLKRTGNQYAKLNCIQYYWIKVLPIPWDVSVLKLPAKLLIIIGQ